METLHDAVAMLEELEETDYATDGYRTVRGNSTPAPKDMISSTKRLLRERKTKPLNGMPIGILLSELDNAPRRGSPIDILLDITRERLAEATVERISSKPADPST